MKKQIEVNDLKNRVGCFVVMINPRQCIPFRAEPLLVKITYVSHDEKTGRTHVSLRDRSVVVLPDDDVTFYTSDELEESQVRFLVAVSELTHELNG
jgi:hypothetical protein